MFPHFKTAPPAPMPLTSTGERKLPIGHAIRCIRLERGLSAYRLAKNAGFLRCHMGKIERDELCCGPLGVLRIARTLDIEPWKIYRYAFRLLERMEP